MKQFYLYPSSHRREIADSWPGAHDSRLTAVKLRIQILARACLRCSKNVETTVHDRLDIYTLHRVCDNYFGNTVKCASQV